MLFRYKHLPGIIMTGVLQASCDRRMKFMDDVSCSRREFLKKFIILFVGALMLSATIIACPTNNYSALPSVASIYFYNAGMQKDNLRGHDNVPVHTQFEFVFTADMDTDLSHSRTRISFVDSNNNPVAFTPNWVDARTLSVTPNADLTYNTEYTLTVDDAEDTLGNPLNTYANSSAKFRTASI
jgi:hypothetical protein